MKKSTYIVIIVAVVIAIIGMLYYMDALPGFQTCYRKELYLEGDGTADQPLNTITLPACAIEKGNSVETVFSSIIDKGYAIVIFFESYDGDLDSWVKDRPYNTLTTVSLDGTYLIQVNQDCVLEI